MFWLRPLLLALLLQGLSAAANAHSRSTSYSVWELGSEAVSVRVRLAEIDLTRLRLHPDYTPDYPKKVADVVRQGLQLSRGGQDCRFAGDTNARRADGQVILQATAECPASGDYAIRSHLLLGPLPSHLHFAQVVWPDGQSRERVLTADANQWSVAAKPARGAHAPGSLGGFWWLGVEHILSGWDHLAFVFGLILLATTLRQVVWLVTGFTVAHSLTLALAVLGWAQPAGGAVEALIALSILLIAVEAAWQLAGRPRSLPLLTVLALAGLALLQPGGLPVMALAGMALFSLCYFQLLQQVGHPHRVRALVAFGFGLFHGFGFAGVLAEMNLSSAHLVSALLGFNLGVESGQLLVIALIWPLLRWLSRHSQALPQIGTAAVAGLGCYWFVLRAFT